MNEGSKLKNETSQAEAMRKKLRFGKADTAETATEIKKVARLKEQGRKTVRRNASRKTVKRKTTVRNNTVVSGELRHRLNEANEDENAGGDAINAGSQAVENGIYSMKRKTGRVADANGYAEKLHSRNGATVAKNETVAKHEAQKSLMKKEIQKQAYKEQTREAANSVGNIARKFVDRAEDMAGKLAEAVIEFVEEHPLGILLAGALLLILLLVTSTLSSCSILAGGGNNVILDTSFTAQDGDIVAVENSYKNLEAELQTKINNIATEYPGYDEYRTNADSIVHDPFELAALLTVQYEDYTQSQVAGILATIKDQQYTLTITPVTEIRTRTETRWHYVTYYRTEPRTGTMEVDGKTVEYTYYVQVPYQVYESYEVEVEYEYHILNTTLINNGIQAAVNAAGLTTEQQTRYNILLQTQGNKPDIF